MKRGTPDHPKVLMLAAELRRLGIPMPRTTAVGILEMLWQWAAKYAIQGDVGRWPDEIIEAALEWVGEPGALVTALIRTKWLDEAPEPHRLVIHDIHDHADNTWRQCLDDSGLTWWDGRPPRREKPGRPKNSISSESSAPRDGKSGTPKFNLHQTSRQKQVGLQSNSRQTPDKLQTNASETPQPEPEPEPEPLAAVRKLPNTPLTPHDDSPPPLTPVEKPVEISAGAAEQSGNGKSPPPLIDSRSAIRILAERREMDPQKRRAPPQPTDEAGLAIAVVGRMLRDWMEHRADALGPPDEALCRRLLEAHGMSLERIRDWLLGLRRRGKHPGSVQGWGWFVTLAEADARRAADAVAVAEAAAAGGVA